MIERSLKDHLFEKGPKRILAVDGGGARGIIACGILKRIETLLKRRLPEKDRAAFRLHHYYDLIGGTSTGSIIAAGLSTGLTVDEMTQLYLKLCPVVFKDRKIGGVRKSKFDSAQLGREIDSSLREEDGDLIRLGSNSIKTGLALFAKRIDTGGSWSLTNHPDWVFYDKAAATRHGKGHWEFVENKDLPLARLVQASAAAPTYFDAVGLDVDANADDGMLKVEGFADSVFVDGALSGRNMPALQLFFMAQYPAFGFRWPTGADNLLLTSVGAGWWRPKINDAIMALNPVASHARVVFQAIECLQTLVHDGSLQALTILQGLSRTPTDPKKRWEIDAEVGDLAGFGFTPEPLLNFRRMDIRFDRKNLAHILGKPVEEEAEQFGEFIIPKAYAKAAEAWDETPLIMCLRSLSQPDPNVLKLLYHIGARYAETHVDDDDFPPGFDIGTQPRTA